MSDEYSTAIHEAGHAVMAIRFKRKLRYVTIEREGDSLGLASLTSINLNTKEKVNRECIIGLSGGIAEGLITETDDIDYSLHDQEKVLNLCLSISNDDYEKAHQTFMKTLDQVIQIMRDPLVRQQIKVLANALGIYRTLSYAEVKNIISNIEE